MFHISALKRKETAIHWQQLAANWCSECWSSVFYASTALVGPGLLREVPWSHSDTPHSVGLLWTSDRPIIKISTWRRTMLPRDRHLWSLPPPAGFETRAAQCFSLFKLFMLGCLLLFAEETHNITIQLLWPLSVAAGILMFTVTSSSGVCLQQTKLFLHSSSIDRRPKCLTVSQ